MDFIKNQSGQTGIEYILLLAVISLIIFSLMGRVREQLLGTQPCPVSDRSLGCTITRTVSSFGSTPNFRYFRLRK